MKKVTCLIGVIMGSKSDWPIMKHAADVLDKLKIKYETKVVSAHRTPDLLYKYDCCYGRRRLYRKQLSLLS